MNSLTLSIKWSIKIKEPEKGGHDFFSKVYLKDTSKVQLKYTQSTPLEKNT